MKEYTLLVPQVIACYSIMKVVTGMLFNPTAGNVAERESFSATAVQDKKLGEAIRACMEATTSSIYDCMPPDTEKALVRLVENPILALQMMTALEQVADILLPNGHDAENVLLKFGEFIGDDV